MLRTAVLVRRSLQDGALLTAAVWGVLVGLHLLVGGPDTPLSQETPGGGAECQNTVRSDCWLFLVTWVSFLW